MKRRESATRAPEQLSVGFEGLEAAAELHEPSPETMRQIVSLRMPDALVARVEAAAQARGVSPSSLMRALIAAGLDRSYAAVTEPSDVAAEIASLRRSVERIASRLEGSRPLEGSGAEPRAPGEDGAAG